MESKNDRQIQFLRLIRTILDEVMRSTHALKKWKYSMYCTSGILDIVAECPAGPLFIREEEKGKPCPVSLRIFPRY